ncbi:phenylalanine--tRNA ligase subunit beta [Lachnoclostridium sp. Marseille-P6806]|uniref:phenylalanine--tRNA ligase subunit beta n=1 Tax=Lachnoclostridium sp. Marseille-P6806 TaxID=2364793 RepID=UPI001031EDA7|nr:phenylalanine--tRNA ligase subunit beta [Lachnoclostridium sp. Marseille-P6806]
MLAPLSWLKDFVDIDVTPEELQEKLFSCGFEVEELRELGAEVSGVVTGLVESCEPIPDTHLYVCRVNAGAHGVFQVCCGADNVAAGRKFPLALVGAQVIETARDHVTVIGTAKITKGKLRGYDSEGMLCSGTELGVTEDMYPGAGYNGLLELPEDAEPGADVKPILGLDDWIFDIAVTANRPDCQSILGIAREVAAVLGKKLRMPALDYTETDVRSDGFDVSVEAPELCPRYIGHYVYDVRIAGSPAWMRRRLALVGHSAISNIVDITNYVLTEIGQPMHAFDSRYLRGNRIVVRRAAKGEKIVTLDEKEFVLNDQNLVICDGEGPVALAGIMGGLHSGIREDTESVVFEAACFARDNIRRTSRALGQSSDSSAAFSRGIYEYTAELGMRRALHLIEELGAGKISATHEDKSAGCLPKSRSMEASLEKICGVLGIAVPEREIIRILTDLDMKPELQGDRLTIQIPPYREDMEAYPDIAEEIIRMYGYDHVESTFLREAQVTMGGRNPRQKTELKLKRMLCAAGACECMHYSFFSPSDLELLALPEEAPERRAIGIVNPINEDLSLMRTTLIPQMIRAISRNQKKATLEGRLFEMANRFEPKNLPLSEYPEEKPALAIGIWGEQESFFTLKGLTETVADTLLLHFSYEPAGRSFLHPGRSARILCEGEEVGCLGQLAYPIGEETDMRVPAYLAELDLDRISKWYGKPARFRPLPKFPEEKRDLALVMEKNVRCGEVEEVIRSACRFVTDVRLFDVYEGLPIPPSMKSMAFTVTFTPEEEAFGADTVDGYVNKILKKLKFTMGIELRS